MKNSIQESLVNEKSKVILKNTIQQKDAFAQKYNSIIRDFTPRLYQERIFASCVNKDSLVILPTGLGKTAVALMMVAHRLSNYPDKKIIILAPTKPLVEQHMNYFTDKLKLHDEAFSLFTGQVTPVKRQEMWQNSNIIFSTPQGLENDIIASRINLDDVSLMVFDEAHRGVGGYSYVFIADQYFKKAKYGRILALTASPGASKEKIEEVCNNLYIENLEVKSPEDPDVKPYVKETEINYKEVAFNQDFLKIKNALERIQRDRIQKIALLGEATISPGFSRKQMLAMMLGLQNKAREEEKTIELLKTISVMSEIMKVAHAEELLESQGIAPLYAYLDKTLKSASTSKIKSVKNLVSDPNFKAAYIYTKMLKDKNIEHPKMHELKEIVKSYANKKIIIFTQYRETGKQIKKEIESINGINSELFVGQSKKSGTGLSQKEQVKVLHRFRQGEFNSIIMTSVGEEGLDIPQVDLVVFYEPIPSAVRSIQRRGRTGRLDDGKVIVLVSKGTRDEAYRWSAHHKEKRMLRLLKEMKLNPPENKERQFVDQENRESTDKIQVRDNKIISEFVLNIKKENGKIVNPNENGNENSFDKAIKENQEISDQKVIIDYREKNSLLVKELVNKNIKLDLRQLAVGDYILSSRVGVEYKQVSDFVDSIVDGRVLGQIKALKNNFEKPILIIEGSENIYNIRRINQESINGILSTITISFGVPIIYTKTSKETASLFATIHKKEFKKGFNKINLHQNKPLTLKEQQEYFVSALPGIGPNLATPLLQKFKSIFNILTASLEDLQEVDKIGIKKATEIRNIINAEYFAWKQDS